MYIPKNRLLRVYISGAISNDPNYQSKFQNATNYIKSDNPKLIVFNPARLADYLKLVRFTWGQYMQIALNVIPKCDIVYFLEDYVISHGARIEMELARKTNKIIAIEGGNEPPTWKTKDFNLWLKTNYNLTLSRIYNDDAD